MGGWRAPGGVRRTADVGHGTLKEPRRSLDPMDARGFVLLLVVPALAGCLAAGPGGPSDTGTGVDATRGHPYPPDDAWPANLTGPFDMRSVDEVRVTSFDGTELEGWIVRPDVPNGTQVPVVLWSSPYFGQNYPAGDDPALWDNSNLAEAVPVNLLVEEGYAVAIFNMRGSGNSGGCLTWFGPRTQQDQAFLVQWLGNRSWSNGRVGMMGLSYHGTTPWAAAIHRPPALKTIVVAGMISDPYQFYHTPQGAPFTIGGAFNGLIFGLTSLTPPTMGQPEDATAQWVPVAPDRLCPEAAATLLEIPKDHWTDRRDPAFWKARRLIDGFPNITTSILLTHGFQDLWISGHQMQEDPVWHTLEQAPARMMVGQWGHEFPNYNSYNSDWALTDWNETLLGWLDYWLKGLGDGPPDLGVVEYQDRTGTWHNSTSWPPAEAADEVLFLRDGELSTGPGEASATFRSVPQPGGPEEVLCPDAPAPPVPYGQVFATAPVEGEVLLAGNPMAYLNVGSDLPGGIVAVHLFDLGREFACEDGRPQDAVRLAVGMADLRFHEGNYVGEDFPIGQPSPVRVDITNLAEVIEEGHRLAAVIGYGDPVSRTSQPYYPRITLHGGDAATASQLAVPVVNGTLGGMAPVAEYPPRPFVPGG